MGVCSSCESEGDPGAYLRNKSAYYAALDAKDNSVKKLNQVLAQQEAAALREQEEAKKQQEWDNLTPEEQTARVSAYHMRLLEEVCESLCQHGVWVLPFEIKQQREEFSTGMASAEAALALIRNESSNTHHIITHHGKQLGKYPDFSKITGDVRYVLQWISDRVKHEIKTYL